MELQQSPPAPTQPVTGTVAPIAYFEDAAETEPWARVVKAIAIIGVVVAGADAVSLGLQLLPHFGGPTVFPFSMFGSVRPLRGIELVYIVGGVGTAALLLSGGIACLGRSNLGPLPRIQNDALEQALRPVLPTSECRRPSFDRG